MGKKHGQGLLVSAELDSLACEYIDDEIAGIWPTNRVITMPMYVFIFFCMISVLWVDAPASTFLKSEENWLNKFENASNAK